MLVAGLALGLLAVLGACRPAQDVSTGPRLVAERTLGAETPLPVVNLAATPIRLTQEQVSPLSLVTVDAAYVLVTPTLPPSKTPTRTPTFTPTPTISPTPTTTATATATQFLLPTSEIVAVTAQVAAPAARVCDSVWFFREPRPASCPLNPPRVAQGVYQTFQNGYMVWVGGQDAIYVMYNDMQTPRWQVFRDYFQEGMPESAPEYSNAPQSSLWQPRRGFGMLWRANATVRDRIGWATMEWEQGYSVHVQTGSDGAIFISQPANYVFSLFPNGANWTQYGVTSTTTLPGGVGQPQQPGSSSFSVITPGAP